MQNWYKLSQSGASLQWVVDHSKRKPSIVLQAIGNTYPIKDKLKDAGFSWDNENRVWYAKYNWIHNRLNDISRTVGIHVPDVSTLPQEFHYLVGLAPEPPKTTKIKRKLLIPRWLTNLQSFLLGRRPPNFAPGGINSMITDNPVIAMYEFIEPKSIQSLTRHDLERLIWPWPHKYETFDRSKEIYEDTIKPLFDCERKDPEMYDFLTSESVSNDHPVLQRANDLDHWDPGSIYAKPDDAKKILQDFRSDIPFRFDELKAYRDLLGPNGDALKQECERKIAAIDQMTPRNKAILKLITRNLGAMIIRNPQEYAQKYPELFAKTPDYSQRFPGDALGFHQITPDEIDGLADELVQLGFLKR